MNSDTEAQEARDQMIAALEPRPMIENPARDASGETVTIAYPHLDTFGANFVDSLLRMVAYDKATGNHLLHQSGLRNTGALAAVWGRSVELSHARNTAAAGFLASEADWLLWIDTDIGFEPVALEKLLAAADPQTRPVVGGLCFIETEFGHDFHGGLTSRLSPTLYDWSWVEPDTGMPGAYKLAPRSSWKPEEVTRVAATGCGMLLIHRSVFEKISAWLIEQGAPAHIWYERIPGPDGEKCGEDISFCLRVHQVGLPVYVHTGVTTTHQKTAWYGVKDYHLKPATPVAASMIALPPEQWPMLRINPNTVEDAQRDTPMQRT